MGVIAISARPGVPENYFRPDDGPLPVDQNAPPILRVAGRRLAPGPAEVAPVNNRPQPSLLTI